MNTFDGQLYADVILALHIPYSLTYRVPEILQERIKTGQRVAVQLRGRIYSAVVIKLYSPSEDNTPDTSDKDFTAAKNMQMILNSNSFKYIIDIIDTEPVMTDIQTAFFKWVADYYIAYIGDVLTAAMPASLRLKSETTLAVSPYFDSDISSLDGEELKVFNAVAQKDKVALEDIKTGADSKNILKIVNKLIRNDVLITDEELNGRYSVKKEMFLSLNTVYEDKNELKNLLDTLDKSHRSQPQCGVILKYLSLVKDGNAVKKTELEEKGCNPNTVAPLVKKGILVKQLREVSRLKSAVKSDDAGNIILNEKQRHVYDTLISNWDNVPVSLIHGVTGSGKTEVYIKLIDRVLKQTKSDSEPLPQVLYLLPEIALTMQLMKRLEKYFGDKAVLYNAKFSNVERAEIWQRTMTDDKDKKFQIIIGSRSSVFLPFTNLKLVIIDEEHDTSFKQNEPVPHYNGRDCALYLAKMFKAKTVLGSATPNVETYKLASEGKYELSELDKQYYDVPLPEIELIDMKEEIKSGSMHGVFSFRMYEQIKYALDNKKQVIVFQNRRGYAPHVECKACGYVPKCPNCDVSLVLHKDKHDLECHYCGYSAQVTGSCPQCGSHAMRFVGSGTQKIEEDLQLYFPKAVIKRMDLDSIRTKQAYTSIINDFSSHKIDILCGTQILTKGLDFDNVYLVGVLGADFMLHQPDFRAYERTFQLLTQVSGRAGRRHMKGKVLIQTFEPQNPVMKDVINRDYNHMYQMQLKERQMMNFPPYCRMIKITLQHRDRDLINRKSYEYALGLKKIFGARLFGPQEPVIARIKNLYAMDIWLKVERQLPYTAAKQRLRQYNEEFTSQRTNTQIRISINVDPV